MIILVVSFKQNLNFKIQMLAGKSLISFLNAGSEENSTLGITYKKRRMLSHDYTYHCTQETKCGKLVQ